MLRALANRKLITASACLFFLVVVIVTSLVGTRKVRIFDSRFHVLSVNVVSRGTNQVFEGNQLEGRLRDKLLRLGLKVKPLPSMRFATKEPYAFVVRYSWDLTEKELSDIQAELVDGAGTAIPLRWIMGSRDTTHKEYVEYKSTWVLDSPPTNGARYHLRLKLATNAVGLAEVRVGRL